MSVVKNYVTIRLQLIQIDVLEVAILLVTYLVYYVFQSKQKILHVFNMITGIIKSEILAKHIWCKCKSKVDSKKCNSNQKRNNDRCQLITRNNVSLSVKIQKNNLCAKTILFGILQHVVEMVNVGIIIDD